MTWEFLRRVGICPGRATGAVRRVRKNGQLAPWRSCRVPPTLRKVVVRVLSPSIVWSLVYGIAWPTLSDCLAVLGGRAVTVAAKHEVQPAEWS